MVGPNGAGKSTFLKIILGIDYPDKGIVKKSQNVSIGYLPQEIISGSNQSIIKEVLNSFPEVSKIEQEIRLISKAIEKNPSNETLLEKLASLHQKFEDIDGWRIEDNAKKFLAVLDSKIINFIYHLTHLVVAGECVYC